MGGQRPARGWGGWPFRSAAGDGTLSRMRVLILNPRDEVAALVAALGHEARPVHALHALAAERGELLLADLPRQPGGWQAALTAGRDAGLPVVFINPTADARQAAEALRAGANDVLPSPLEARTLHLALRLIGLAPSPSTTSTRLSRQPPAHLDLDPAGLDLDAWHRAIVISALGRHGGSPVRTAEYLGLTRKVLYTLRKRYGLLAPGEAEDG